MPKALLPSGTKSFPFPKKESNFLSDVRDIRNIFPSLILSSPQEICTLKKWVIFLEYHCNGSICLREWTSFSYRVDFQQSLAEATRSCTVQSAGFLALWFVIKLREKGSGFYFDSWCFLPHWMITALWKEQAGVSLCMCDDNRRAWFAISGCLMSLWSQFKQSWLSG